MTMKIVDLEAKEPEKTARNKWDHIEQWLSQHWPTRMNEVKMVPEYQDKRGNWHSVSDYWRNSVLRELRDAFYTVTVKNEAGEMEEKKVSMATTRAKLDEIINSDFSPRVDIFKDYLNNLPEADGISAINKLARSVTIKNPDMGDGVNPSDLWPEYLRMWLIACVANFYNDQECENQTMLVLIGRQNDGKTTWLNNLVPKVFNPTYRFCSGLQDPRGKDAMVLLVSMFLVNVDDQLGSITKKDADGIKNLITMPKVTIRLPYDKYTNDHPHRASLCGSLNYSGFLTDPTGNRRYLPFELEKIDWDYINPDKPEAYVDINEVWAEAKTLYDRGVSFKFANEQLKQLEEHNRAFMAPSTESDLISKYLGKAPKWDQVGTVRMTPTEVLLYLTDCAGPALKRTMYTSTIKREMESAGYEIKQRQHHGQHGVRVFCVLPQNNTGQAQGDMSYQEKKEQAQKDQPPGDKKLPF